MKIKIHFTVSTTNSFVMTIGSHDEVRKVRRAPEAIKIADEIARMLELGGKRVHSYSVYDINHNFKHIYTMDY